MSVLPNDANEHALVHVQYAVIHPTMPAAQVRFPNRQPHSHNPADLVAQAAYFDKKNSPPLILNHKAHLTPAMRLSVAPEDVQDYSLRQYTPYS